MEQNVAPALQCCPAAGLHRQTINRWHHHHPGRPSASVRPHRLGTPRPHLLVNIDHIRTFIISPHRGARLRCPPVLDFSGLDGSGTWRRCPVGRDEAPWRAVAPCYCAQVGIETNTNTNPNDGSFIDAEIAGRRQIASRHLYRVAAASR